MPCHAMPYHAMPCHAIPCYTNYAMLCYTVLYHAMIYYTMLCYAVPYRPAPSHPIHTTRPHTTTYHTLQLGSRYFFIYVCCGECRVLIQNTHQKSPPPTSPHQKKYINWWWTEGVFCQVSGWGTSPPSSPDKKTKNHFLKFLTKTKYFLLLVGVVGI
jgi:hypothetical protein